MLEGLRGKERFAELCRKEGLNLNVYCHWSKDFLEAGKKRLSEDNVREATSNEVNHKPRLLSDNGPCYISDDLADYLEENGMTHTRDCPYQPQTQGKIERWQSSMKNQILLSHYYFPSELEEQLQRFVSYYNHERYHESLDNVTPADVFYGRGE